MDGFASWEPVEKQFTVSTEIHPSVHQYLTAVNPANHLHNNSMEYVAVDLTRVVLQPSIASTDYINASWVPGYTGDRQFIISQHPNNYSLEQFWHMVWQTETQTIMCLSTFQQPVSSLKLLFESFVKGQTVAFRMVGIVCYVTTINGNIIKLIQSISSYL